MQDATKRYTISLLANIVGNFAYSAISVGIVFRKKQQHLHPGKIQPVLLLLLVLFSKNTYCTVIMPSLFINLKRNQSCN